MSKVTIRASGVSVGSAAYTTLLTYKCPGYSRVGFGWEVADQALASTKIQVRMSEDDEWDDLLVDADLEDDANPLLLWGMTGSYRAAAGARGKVSIRLPACYAVRVVAKSAAGTASVDAHATFTEGG